MVFNAILICVSLLALWVTAFLTKDLSPSLETKLHNATTNRNRRLRRLAVTLGSLLIVGQGVKTCISDNQSDAHQRQLLKNQQELARIISPVTNLFQTTNTLVVVQELVAQVRKLNSTSQGISSNVVLIHAGLTELARETAPRRLTDDQRRKFVANGHGTQGSTFRIAYPENDPEMSAYGKDIVALFRAARIETIDEPIPLVMRSGSIANGLELVLLGPDVVPGGSPEQAQRAFALNAPPALVIISNALLAAGIPFSVKMYPGQTTNTFVVNVGPRPTR